MRLLALHADTVSALERLHMPFDDLTPQGLWGTPYHLIGVTADQRDVLRAWNIQAEDCTPQNMARHAPAPTLRDAVTDTNRPRPTAGRPAAVASATANAAASSTPAARPAPPRAAEPASDEEVKRPRASIAADAAPQPASAEAKQSAIEASAEMDQADDASDDEAEVPTQVAAEPAAPAQNAKSNGATDTIGPMRLRINVGGRYKEASIREGQIHVDGRTFDSPASASRGIASGKAEWSFWEYFDEGAGKWRMLDRNWQPT